MYEAQAYVTLTSLIQATAVEVSEKSNIPRSKIYDVLKKLNEKDFIEIEDGRPLTYVVKSPVEVINREKEKIDTQLDDTITRLTNIYENGMSQVQAPIWRIYGVDKIIAQELECFRIALTDDRLAGKHIYHLPWVSIEFVVLRVYFGYVHRDLTETVVFIPGEEKAGFLAFSLQRLAYEQRGRDVTEVSDVDGSGRADTGSAYIFFFVRVSLDYFICYSI